MPATRDQSPDPPRADGADGAEVVSLFGRTSAAGRLERGAGQLQRAYRTVADVRRGVAAGWEALVATPASPPASPAAWADRGRARGAIAIEAELLVAALRARRHLPAIGLLFVEVTAQALLARPVQRTLVAASPLDGVVLMIVDGARPLDPLVLGAALEGARRAGARIAVEEAEAGHVALRRIARLGPSYVRVAAGLVADVEHPASAATIESLVSLAARIDGAVIADGVADVAQLRALAAAGVTLATGPLFRAPAATMQELEPGLAATLRGDGGSPDPHARATMGELMGDMPVLGVDAALHQLADVFLDDPAHDHVLLLQGDGRPAALAERAAFLRGEPWERPVIWATPDSDVGAVARRAMERPPLERFAPVVCGDGSGRYLGAVRVELLIRALAGER